MYDKDEIGMLADTLLGCFGQLLLIGFVAALTAAVWTAFGSVFGLSALALMLAVWFLWIAHKVRKGRKERDERNRRD